MNDQQHEIEGFAKTCMFESVLANAVNEMKHYINSPWGSNLNDDGDMDKLLELLSDFGLSVHGNREQLEEQLNLEID
jgi:hypothetical protein